MGEGKVIAAIILLTAVASNSAFIILNTAQRTPPTSRTFYAVAYSWGYAFFDEGFNRVDRIAVNRGDRVLLHAMSVQALSEGGIRAFADEQVKNGLGRLPPNDPLIRELVQRAMDYGLWNHTLTIGGYGVTVEISGSKSLGKAQGVREAVAAKDPSIRTVEFVADKVGRFLIYCAVYECGYGHTDMVVSPGLVVS